MSSTSSIESKKQYRELPSSQIIAIAEACLKAREVNADATWLGVTDGDFKDVTIIDRTGTFILDHQLNPYVCGSWLHSVGKSLSLFTKQVQGDDTLAGKLTNENNRALTLINEELRRMFPSSLGFIQYEAQGEKLDEPGVRHYIRNFTRVYHLQSGISRNASVSSSVMTAIPFSDLKEWLYPGSLVASKNRYQVSGSEESPFISSVVSKLLVRRAKAPPQKAIEPIQDDVKEAFEHFDQSNLD